MDQNRTASRHRCARVAAEGDWPRAHDKVGKYYFRAIMNVSIHIPQPHYHLATKLIAVMMMVQMLLEDKRKDEVGLLVDWLKLLDPTIISSCPKLQMKLVFGKSKVR